MYTTEENGKSSKRLLSKNCNAYKYKKYLM